MEIILILISGILAVYFYTKLIKLNKEIKVKDSKINELSRKIGEYQSLISKYQSENNSFKSKLQLARAEVLNLQINTGN